MDLVLLSTRFVQSKVKTLGVTKSQVWQCAAHLKRSGVAVDDSVLAIPSAKVPIVKFIDKVTGLRVDLSFDNDSGIIANDTFLAWKLEYPAMPIIVSIVKQFLLLRGLNDVATGGLGGFSIICLVTSLLQHLPPSGGLPNLGTLLMDFFNFYGNEFDQSTLGINLNPPGYFDKVRQFTPLRTIADIRSAWRETFLTTRTRRIASVSLTQIDPTTISQAGPQRLN